jgi:hypothetical protein
MVGPVAMAQQPPPAWSPAPFVDPTGSNIPVNKLRSNTPEASVESPVLRWKVVSPEDQGRSSDKSFSQALGTSDKDARSVTQSNVVRQPMAQSPSMPNQPRSTFNLNPPRTTTANDVQVKFASDTKSSAQAAIRIGERGLVGDQERRSVSEQGVSLASHGSGSIEANPASSSASVGVWYDRKAGANESKSSAVQRTRFHSQRLQESKLQLLLPLLSESCLSLVVRREGRLSAFELLDSDTPLGF